MISHLRQSFDDGVLSTIDQRLNQLQQIDLLLQENKEEIEEAVFKDLHKVRGDTNMPYHLGSCAKKQGQSFTPEISSNRN